MREERRKLLSRGETRPAISSSLGAVYDFVDTRMNREDCVRKLSRELDTRVIVLFECKRNSPLDPVSSAGSRIQKQQCTFGWFATYADASTWLSPTGVQKKASAAHAHVHLCMLVLLLPGRCVQFACCNAVPNVSSAATVHSYGRTV